MAQQTVDYHIAKTLFKDMGWRGLRKLQSNAYDEIRGGKNALLTAGTASGKTEAALLPVLSLLMEDETLYNSQTPIMLYCAPLKALINDIYARIKKLTARTRLTTFCWHGDVSPAEKKEALKSASIIVTTPESIEGMLISGKIDHQRFFTNLRFILIDELHALINGPRGAQLASLIERLNAISQHDLQKIAMSATIGNPEEVLQWIQGGSKRQTIHIDDSKSGKKMLMIRKKSLESLLSDVNRMLSVQGKGIVFTASKQEAEILNHFFTRKGVRCLLHHGSIGKQIREETEETFKCHPDFKLMIATTTLEMGIDIGDVAYVYFYSIPKSAASFMQRLGRAGRKSGVAKSLIYVNTELENEKKLMNEHLHLFANIQLLIDNRVEPIDMIEFYPQILAHQIISMTLSQGLIHFSDLSVLKNAFSFKGIGHLELSGLLQSLHKEGYLSIRGDEIRMGSLGNNLFSGSGIGEFVSVFDAGKTYQVLYGKKEIGQIHYATISSQKKLEGAEFSQRFILAGKAWKVVQSDPFKKILQVIPTEKGVKPMWLGKGVGIAARFADAARRFVLNPRYPENIKVDDAVMDALLDSIDQLRLTVSEDSFYTVQRVSRQRSVDMKVYTYAGEIKNMLYSILISEFFDCVKTVKYDWQSIWFKSIQEIEMEDFFRWVDSLDYETFETILSERLKEESKKIGELIFQDRFADLVDERILIKAFIKIFYDRLEKASSTLKIQPA
ncbi:MAG: DEAD/DEAH box helicase [Thermotogota bacterium]